MHKRRFKGFNYGSQNPKAEPEAVEEVEPVESMEPDFGDEQAELPEASEEAPTDGASE